MLSETELRLYMMAPADVLAEFEDELSEIVKAGKKVVFDLPDEVEKAGFSKATKARLDSTKLQKLGWKAQYGIEEGIHRTMKMMRES